jgi:hypothetical protein
MKPDSTVYTGERIADQLGRRDTACECVVKVDGVFLSPKASQKLRNHSPDGFNWGYGGSGPAQLALAILLDFLQDKNRAQSLYQSFKWKVIAMLPQEESWAIHGREIREFVEGEGVEECGKEANHERL